MANHTIHYVVRQYELWFYCEYSAISDKIIVGGEPMTFGDRLRYLLEERGLTQKQLSQSLNIAASTIGNYIRNIREPDYGTLKSLATYFNVSVDYLLDRQADPSITGDERELLRIFRALPKDQQELYLEQGKAFITYNNKKADPHKT
jgi:transcriptional regulator with XRE-family HTH domain